MKHISKKTALGSKKALTPKCNNKLAVHFSKKSDEWASPQRLVEILRKVFKISLDVCSTDFNKICERHFTKLLDGLKQSWAREVAFMNPPYSEIGVWMRKAYESALNEGATVVCLVPARTDTKWWHDFVMQGNNQIVFIKGRLKFGAFRRFAWMERTGLLGAVRPQTPHRSPRQAFGGNLEEAVLRTAQEVLAQLA